MELVLNFSLEKEGPPGSVEYIQHALPPLWGGRIQSVRAFRQANVEVVGGPKGGPADELRDSAPVFCAEHSWRCSMLHDRCALLTWHLLT